MTHFGGLDKRPYSIMDFLEKSIAGVFGPRFWEFSTPVLIYGMVMGPLYYFLIRGQFEDLREMANYQATGSEIIYPRGFWPQLEGSVVNLIGLVAFVIVTQYVLRRMDHFIFAEEVPWQETLRDCLDPQRLVSFIATSLAAVLLIWAGCWLCLLPGMALMIVFTLLPVCLTFHPQRFSFPLREPFALLKGRFLVTVSTLAVPKLIYLLISGFIGFLMFMKMDLGLLEESYPPDPEVIMELTMSMYQEPGLIFLQVVSAVFTGLFLLVLGFITVLMYHNYKLTGNEHDAVSLDQESYPAE